MRKASVDIGSISLLEDSNDTENTATAALTIRLCQHATIKELEFISSSLWQRIRSHSTSPLLHSWGRRPHLQSLGGDLQISGYRVKGISNFPSVKLNGINLLPNSGRWYYEVVLLTDGLMQIGWADSLHSGDPICGRGIGDHKHSFAFDGYRKKIWNGESGDYGFRWHIGDIIGCMLDMDELTMQYTINGESLGIAFSNIQISRGLFPAASMNMGQAIRFNFGQVEFIHPPPSIDGYKAVLESISINNYLTNHKHSLMLPSFATNKNSTDILISQNEHILNNLNESNSNISSIETKLSETDHQRKIMIDSLINMGFPIEWCVRAAHEKEVFEDGNLAISWIIEQMEKETINSKLMLHTEKEKREYYYKVIK